MVETPGARASPRTRPGPDRRIPQQRSARTAASRPSRSSAYGPQASRCAATPAYRRAASPPAATAGRFAARLVVEEQFDVDVQDRHRLRAAHVPAVGVQEALQVVPAGHGARPGPVSTVPRCPPGAGGGTLVLPDVLAGGFGVVLFYRGSWCPYCNAQLRAFQRSADDLAGVDASMVALSVDDEPTTRALVDEHGLAFPVGYGADAARVSAATGAFVDPDRGYLQSTGFVLDPAGGCSSASTPPVPSAGSCPRTSWAWSATCASPCASRADDHRDARGRGHDDDVDRGRARRMSSARRLTAPPRSGRRWAAASGTP